MGKFYFLIVIISLLLISGCSKDDNPVNTSTKGNISGKVTDQTSGNAISGASVSTQPATTTVTSDNNGNYTISNIEAGSYTVTATMNGYSPNNVNANVTAGQTTTVNIALTNIPVTPVAGFNYGGTLVTPAVITFTNTSQNADSYLWNFGDGTTSTQANPSKTYNQKGTYTVTLTATNTTSGLSDQTSQNLVITPGKVFLQRTIVDEIPFVDENGAGWDLTSGPDVFFTIIDSVGNVIIDGSGSRVDDVTPSMLPLAWDFTPELEFLKSSWNKTYFIRVWDWDATGDDLIGTTNGFKITQLISNNYPTTVSLQSADAKTKVRLIFRWQ
ncbi:MAG TPA: carboxypeptidase regulatory-like domain-containing protein [Ignavibacteriaceae bacterium]|nr:carboxypeptidase regulatory-like domain-containing protein [Ignavibacteriaceae bacterium]